MNCLLRIEHYGDVSIDGYEQPSEKLKDLWVFEISYNQESIAQLLQDAHKILTKQEKELRILREAGASITLFLEHQEPYPVLIKNETLVLLGSVGANLEISHPNET